VRRYESAERALRNAHIPAACPRCVATVRAWLRVQGATHAALAEREHRRESDEDLSAAEARLEQRRRDWIERLARERT